MVAAPLLDALLTWAHGDADIEALTLFGSHARGQADASSDIDLHVVTRQPQRLFDSAWTAQLAGQHLHVYVVRPATGGVKKVTALFAAGEVDLVVVPTARFRLARWAMALGLHRRPGKVQAGLSQMALIMRPAHRVVKGAARWAPFYNKVLAEVPDPRIDDQEARALADAAYVDAVWILRKAARGELTAAQRWLHRTPIETNFRLLNEWRLRRGLPPAFDARRAERVLPPEELALITVCSGLDAPSLQAAARQCVDHTRTLLRGLTGTRPDWPDLPD